MAAKRGGECLFLILRREQHQQRGEDTTKQASKAKNKTIELLQMTRGMQRRDEILTRERHGKEPRSQRDGNSGSGQQELDLQNKQKQHKKKAPLRILGPA